MDILTLLKVIVRRWMVVVPVLLLVVFAGQRTVSEIDPEYESSAKVLLLPPTDESAPGSNPFVGFGNYLNTTGLALQTILNDASRHDEVARAGFSADYTVTVDTEAPIVHLTAKAHAAPLANQTVARLVNLLAVELRANQDAVGATPANQISMKVLTQPVASKANAQQNRAMIAFAVAGFAAVAGVAVTAESWALARARRRGAGASGATDDAPSLDTFGPPPMPVANGVPSEAQPVGASDSGWKGARRSVRRSRASSGER